MSANKGADIDVAEPKITLEDVKHRAEAVRDLAKSEAKRATNTIMHERATQAVMVGVGVVAVLASLAYLMGTRKGRASCPPPLPPYHCFPPE